MWARSLRGRVTLIATAVAASVLIPVGIGGVAVARSVVEAGVYASTRDAAAHITAELRDGDLRGPALRVTDPAVDLLQVVGPGGRVLAASAALTGRPPMTDAWPAADDRILSTMVCREECVHLTAIRVGTDPASPVVYAGRSTPGVLSTRILEAIVMIQVAILIALASWATWLVTGRALRPVAAMRTQLDAVNASDLSRRVSQPSGQDEVAELARSVNSTLARLERSAEQQRQFASDASHELRTPIAGLRAQLESAQLFPDDTELDALVAGALRDTDRLEAIVSDLLLLARIGSRVDVVKEPVDLADLVREELMGRQDRFPVRLSLREGVMVEGVRLQLARLLTNLLDNAERHAASDVLVTVRREGPCAILEVDNDGAEIKPADRERIFERFTRLDAARSRDAGGTGLGLAIARDVALAHRGVITAPEHEGGARFLLRLPALTGEASATNCSNP
ncbi:HAMP domain-containing histidine kinase [Nonomuraea sp. NBC_01738]|uniref:sensor histidine kinase n=1 Tax=Nonomuraea sp. NBC_01738 TaxID=2976003 RepID=UPI002E0D790A|nr:HAMP domain-containing histidine kinase [Nonomuraea sp. NBC_01738]